MILVADSGSTKTEWRIIKDGIPYKSFSSSGINPYFSSVEEIHHLLKKEMSVLSGYTFSKIYYYCTGCNSDTKNDTLRQEQHRK
jgi:glucosamine kinase